MGAIRLPYGAIVEQVMSSVCPRLASRDIVVYRADRASALAPFAQDLILIWQIAVIIYADLPTRWAFSK